MTDARVLLERHKPRLVYDSHEAYFADSAAIWTDSPTNVLKRADGAVLAKPPKLEPRRTSARHLRRQRQGPGDRRDRRHHPPLRRERRRAAPSRRYANRVLRPRAPRPQGPPVAPVLALLLLQRLPAASGRSAAASTRATGSWCRSGSTPPSGPSRRSAPSTRRPRARPGRTRRRSGDDAARLRRARLARELLRQAGSHWTGTGSTRPTARARRSTPDARDPRRRRARVGAVAGAWGDTKPGDPPAGLARARPARASARTGWTRRAARRAPSPSGRPPPPAPPKADRRSASTTSIVVEYEAPPEATALVVAMRPKGSDGPAVTTRLPARRDQGRGRGPRGGPAGRRSLDERGRARTESPPRASGPSERHRETVVWRRVRVELAASTGEIDISNARDWRPRSSAGWTPPPPAGDRPHPARLPRRLRRPPALRLADRLRAPRARPSRSCTARGSPPLPGARAQRQPPAGAGSTPTREDDALRAVLAANRCCACRPRSR